MKILKDILLLGPCIGLRQPLRRFAEALAFFDEEQHCARNASDKDYRFGHGFPPKARRTAKLRSIRREDKVQPRPRWRDIYITDLSLIRLRRGVRQGDAVALLPCRNGCIHTIILLP